MALEYILKIDSDKIEEISAILNVQPSSIEFGWELSLDDMGYESINYFCHLIETNIHKLGEIGIQSDDIQLWLLYEYEEQCNLEFHPKELARIANLSIVLCISCWQKG